MSALFAKAVRSSPGYVCAGCIRRRAAQQVSKRELHATAIRGAEKSSILSLLEERGYVNQIAGDRNALDRLLQSRSVGFYAGIDPTAPSLHLGHLLPLMVLFWLYHHGHYAVSLVGGATARVGDPSGRLTSRAQTAAAVHETNFKTMYQQVGRLWDNAIACGQRHWHRPDHLGRKEMLNNATWLDKLNILDFLKTMGNGMRLGSMLGRDTVRNKMEKGDGMSFSEFTYPLLQAWDWWHMYQRHGVQVQIGGSDQFGNIIAGMDGVRHIAQTSDDANESGWLDRAGKLKNEYAPMGLTVPLLTTASGEKFGKSAGNAVWLDPAMTSAFDLYGFLLRSSDDDVERYLKLFTFLPIADISKTMSEHSTNPGKRKAQHLLASEVLELVHGPEEAAKTCEQHQSLRSPNLTSLSNSGQAGAERTVLPASLVLNTPFSRILYHAGIVPTKSEGTRMVAKGGAYVATSSGSSAVDNTATPQDGDDNLAFTPLRDQRPETVAQYLMNGLLFLRTGKWKVRIVQVIEDADFDAQGLDAPGWAEWKATRSSE